MNRFCIKCPTCGHPIDAELYNRADEAIPCEVCKTKLTIHALPALYRRVRQTSEALLARINDAVCFYHDGKTAEQVCDDCGRFLCGLCVLPIGDDTLCTSCLEQRRKSSGMNAFKPREMRHDKLAMLLSGISLLTIFFWFFPFIPLGLALAALFVAVRFWKRKPQMASGFRLRMILSVLLAVLSSTGTILFVVFMFRTLINA